MKKIIVTFVLAFLILSPALTAQSIGIRGGINLGTISDDPDYEEGIDQTSHLGLIAGGAFEIGIAGPIFIEAQVLYIQKGEELSAEGAEAILTANYIEIPVLFKVKLPAGPVKPYFFAGPNVGFLLSANQEFTENGETEDTDLKDNTSSIDFAVDLGAGVEFSVAPMTSIVVDARYSLGLSNLIDNPEESIGDSDATAKTRGIQIMAGVMFGLN